MRNSIKDWKHGGLRQEAVREFVKYLHKKDKKNKDARERVKRDSAFAKDLFAQLGGYRKEEELKPGEDRTKAIPAKLQFRVYEFIDPNSRDDDLATIILPDPKKDLPDMPDAPTPLVGKINVPEIYRCTWIAWASLRTKKVGKGRK